MRPGAGRACRFSDGDPDDEPRPPIVGDVDSSCRLDAAGPAE
jgi:hypothetical protein